MTGASEQPAVAAERLVAMVVADADGLISYWSRGAQELTGHAASTAVGSPLDLIVPPGTGTGLVSGPPWTAGLLAFGGRRGQHPGAVRGGAVRRWPGGLTLIADARGSPAGAAAVLVPPGPADPPLFDP